MSEYTGEVLTERPKVAPAGSTPPIGMAAVPVIEKEFKDEYDAKKATLKKDYEEKKEEITTTSPFTIPGLLTSPPALVTGAALLGALTTYAAPKVYKGIKERYMTQAPEINRNIDIPTGGFFDVPPNPNINPVNQPEAQAVDKLRKAEELAEANRQLGIGGNQPVAPVGAVPPAPVAPAAPAFNPQAPIGTPLSAAPVGAPAPTPSAGPGSFATNAVVDEVTDMIQKTPDTNTGVTSQVAPQTTKQPVPPVYPKAGTKFKTEADLPPGFVARYDVGNKDRSLGNILGLENRAYARDMFNEGKPFGQSLPGKNQANIDVSNLTRRYFEELQSQIPETLLGRDARQAQKIPSEFGVFAKNTNFGTGVKIGGRAATIFAAADIANAAQQGNYGGAAVQAADVATDYLPIIGQIKQALSPSFAGEGSTLPANIRQMQNEAMLLGSPYAQSPQSVKFRQEQEYIRKIGGRTGAAVPPQYRR